MDYCSLEISWALGSKNQLNDALLSFVGFTASHKDAYK